MSLIITSQDGPLARIRLNRPEVRNAFNEKLIRELLEAFKGMERQKEIRVVVLSGEGDFFCAGADLNWMKSFIGASKKANEADARRLAKLLEYLNRFPKPIVGQIHGAAIAGGMGLVAVCDIVIAAQGTMFGLSEVKLGLIPAVISPYVIAKMGSPASRRYFLTGERFKTDVALSAGLIHEAVPLYALQTRVNEIANEFLSAGPEAVRSCKELIRRVSSGGRSVQEYTVKKIAALRVSVEGQEGIGAFLEKRRPSWLTK